MIVTLTHDPKIDDLALKLALRSKIGYIGSLGSKKTHLNRIERLLKEGLIANKINKINISEKRVAWPKTELMRFISHCHKGKCASRL